MQFTDLFPGAELEASNPAHSFHGLTVCVSAYLYECVQCTGYRTHVQNRTGADRLARWTSCDRPNACRQTKCPAYGHPIEPLNVDPNHIIGMGLYCCMTCARAGQHCHFYRASVCVADDYIITHAACGGQARLCEVSANALIDKWMEAGATCVAHAAELMAQREELLRQLTEKRSQVAATAAPLDDMFAPSVDLRQQDVVFAVTAWAQRKHITDEHLGTLCERIATTLLLDGAAAADKRRCASVGARLHAAIRPSSADWFQQQLSRGRVPRCSFCQAAVPAYPAIFPCANWYGHVTNTTLPVLTVACRACAAAPRCSRTCHRCSAK